METHHLFFPKRDYKSSVAKRFRELPYLCKDCKGNCIPHSQRVDHILGLIDDALGGDDEPQG